MPNTPGRFVPNYGLVEMEQTAELQLAFPTLDVTDNDSWIDITKMVTIINSGNPDERDVEEERNASQLTAMVSVSTRTKRWSPSFICYDTNGVPVSHGATNDFCLKACLEAARKYGIVIPFRYSITNQVGSDLHTHVDLEVTRIEEEGLDVDSTGSSKFTTTCTSSDRATTTVS